MLFYNGTYYWFGEHKIATTAGNRAHVGVRCYSSVDLYNWKNEGSALTVAPQGSGSDIEKGCIIERPKVIYNPKTHKFIMFFHLELKADENYESSRVGIATADQVTGPYTYLHSLRPNAGCYPVSYKEGDELFFNIYFLRDVESGHKSRDMTLFVDDDGKAYHIFSSEDNGTLHIAELSDDYLSHTGTFERIAPGGYNEAPAIFKYGKHYYMITSGCTGWSPNPARMFSATNLFGPWTEHPNPCIGTNSHTTFKSQSTYIFPIEGKQGAFLFMADRWVANNPIDGTYVWLPLEFENGLPVLKWHDEWSLNFFTHTHADLQAAIASGKRLLSSAPIGNNVGEYPQEACNAYDIALKKAEQLSSNADNNVVTNAIMKLNDAAATFQESKTPYELNTLEDGDYYIKVNGLYYLTNSDTIVDQTKLPVLQEKITETAAQVFTLSKHSTTGRYRITTDDIPLRMLEDSYLWIDRAISDLPISEIRDMTNCLKHYSMLSRNSQYLPMKTQMIENLGLSMKILKGLFNCFLDELDDKEMYENMNAILNFINKCGRNAEKDAIKGIFSSALMLLSRKIDEKGLGETTADQVINIMTQSRSQDFEPELRDIQNSIYQYYIGERSSDIAPEKLRRVYDILNFQ